MSALVALLEGRESPIDEAVPEDKVILVSYILDCIGKLSDEERAATEAAAARVFPEASSWQEGARAAFGITPELDPFLVNIWESNRKTSERAGLTSDPLEWAVVVVKENFVRDDDDD